jgi:hypothetical protein
MMLKDTIQPTPDSDLSVCDRCGGQFPGPGVSLNGRIYCCDKCAKGPGAKTMIRMLLPATGLVVLGSVLGWSFARIRH